MALDHVITPSAEASSLLGGSAAYAALAASYFSRPVHLVGIIGHDFPASHLQMLEQRGVSLIGLERSNQGSFSWKGEYHENMNERTTHHVALNVLEHWQVEVPAEIATSPIVVLANMSPDNQARMLASCSAIERFVIADTMDLWIQIASEGLDQILPIVDLFVINEGEAKAFTGCNQLLDAGKQLLAKGPRHVVIKLGEFGAMLFRRADQHSDHEWQLDAEHFFRIPAFPLETVVDPTGAGDTFLGAMAGYLAARGSTQPSFADIRRAVIRGSVLASFTCEAFSTHRIESLTAAEIDEREALMQQLCHW